MAYVFASIEEAPEESCSIGEGLERSYTRNFDVVLDLATSSSADITALQVWEQATGLPQYGDIWVSRDGSRTDLAAYMRKFTGRRSRSDKAKFSLTFDYTTKSPVANDQRTKNRNIGGGTDDVKDLYPDWTMSCEDRLRSPSDGRDLDRHVIANSDGDLFDPMPQFNDPLVVLDYTRYEPGFDGFLKPDLLIDTRYYYGKVNSDLFLGTNEEDVLAHTQKYLDKDGVSENPYDDRYKWLCTKYQLTPKFVGARRVMQRSMQFKYSKSGWKTSLLDAGHYEAKDTALSWDPEVLDFRPDRTKANKKPIISPRTGQPTVKAWPLNGKGSAVTDIAVQAVVYLRFRTRNSVPFAPLGVILE